jgi:hypothetical protein
MFIKSLRVVAAFIAIAIIFAAGIPSSAMSPADKSKLDKLTSEYVTYLRTGNVDGLVALYGQTVTVGKKSYTPDQLKTMYQDDLAAQKDFTVTAIACSGGSSNFTEKGKGIVVGKFKVLFMTKKGGKDKTMQKTVTWKVDMSGEKPVIIDTSDLFVNWWGGKAGK